MERYPPREFPIDQGSSSPYALLTPVLTLALSTPWECPRCSVVVRASGPAPRCGRCGFWDTES